MALIFPLLASIFQSASFSIDKLILSVKKATPKQYLAISFPLITIFTFIIFLIFRPHLGWDLFSGNYFLLITLLIASMAGANLIFYDALKKDLLSEIQTIELLKNLPLIIFAALIFPDERNYLHIILALISAASIFWSHWEKKKLRIMHSTIILLLWNLIASPFMQIIMKALLEIWNPISLQLVSDAAISLFFLIFLCKDIKKIPKKAVPFLFITNAFTTVAWILYYYSYQVSGIIYTVIIFSLQPILVYLSSLIFFKEKFQIKKFVSFAIILASIIIAQL